MPVPESAAASLIQHYAIDLPASDPGSFDGFVALVSPMFDLTRLHPEQPFEARVDSTCLSELYLSRTVAGGTLFERSPQTMARSGTDAIVVVFYLNVGIAFELDGQRQAVAPNDLVFFDLRQPLRIHAEMVDNISLVLPRQKLEELGVAVRDLHGHVLRSGVSKHLLLSHLRACIEVAPRIPAADAQAISDATVRLVAACCHGLTRRVLDEGGRSGLATLAEVKAFIEDRLGDPELGPGAVLSAFSLSRATLYRMFESVGGVAAFILERRLHRAFQLITALDADKPRIKQLAQDLGFAHASAFSRAFKKQFGLSPQEMRLGQKYPSEPSARPWRVPPSAQALVLSAADDSPNGTHDTDD